MTAYWRGAEGWTDLASAPRCRTGSAQPPSEGTLRNVPADGRTVAEESQRRTDRKTDNQVFPRENTKEIPPAYKADACERVARPPQSYSFGWACLSLSCISLVSLRAKNERIHSLRRSYYGWIDTGLSTLLPITAEGWVQTGEGRCVKQRSRGRGTGARRASPMRYYDRRAFARRRVAYWGGFGQPPHGGPVVMPTTPRRPAPPPPSARGATKFAHRKAARD